MVYTDCEFGAFGRDAHAVIEEAKAAGVYVFAGGIDEDVPPILVSADGAVAMGGYPWAPTLDGGFTVLELPSRDEAIAWAARIAKACRCDQELRVFGRYADFVVFHTFFKHCNFVGVFCTLIYCFPGFPQLGRVHVHPLHLDLDLAAVGTLDLGGGGRHAEQQQPRGRVGRDLGERVGGRRRVRAAEPLPGA
jgi:hypothetical protein